MPQYLFDPAVALVLAAAVGLLIGSFLNVVIHRLPRMLEEAGLVDIDAEGSVFTMHGGTPSMEWYVLGLERSMASLVEAGIVNAPTGAAALAEVRDRKCRLLSPLRVTAWGRKRR